MYSRDDGRRVEGEKGRDMGIVRTIARYIVRTVTIALHYPSPF